MSKCLALNLKRVFLLLANCLGAAAALVLLVLSGVMKFCLLLRWLLLLGMCCLISCVIYRARRLLLCYVA